MEPLDEGPFKAAWRELESRVLQLCVYYDPRAAQQWLRTQMGPGPRRMRQMSGWITRTKQRAVENDDPFVPRILESWDDLKQRRNELEHALASGSGLVYHNSRQVRGSYYWTAERLAELTNDTRALTKRVKMYMGLAKLTGMNLELVGAVWPGSGAAHIGGHHPSGCEYCAVQFEALAKPLVDEVIEKQVAPSREGWRQITDNMGFAMTPEETERAVREEIQWRLEHAREVAELLEGWESGVR